MFNIHNYPQIIRHLKKISPGMYREMHNNEIMIHCPYCDDSSRKNAHKHGHLYIATDKPVFNCFRCNMNGTLTRLLIDTNFMDTEILKEISKSSKVNYLLKRDINDKENKERKIYYSFIDIYIKHLSKMKRKDLAVIEKYINSRIGDVDYTSFLLSPIVTKYNDVGVAFYNHDLNMVSTRLINNDKYKYISSSTKTSGSRFYYFQDMMYHKYRDVVICEGPFDTINLFLYNEKNIDPEQTFFIAMLGKRYLSTIEFLLLSRFIIGEYRFIIVFDSDVVYKKNKLAKIEKFVNMFNSSVEVIGFEPITAKDAGECPFLTKLN